MVINVNVFGLLIIKCIITQLRQREPTLSNQPLRQLLHASKCGKS